MYLIFDTETTGLPIKSSAPLTEFENWPRVVQLAWQLHDAKGGGIKNRNKLIKPEGFTIPYNAEKIHGISTDKALQVGEDLKDILSLFKKDLESIQFVVGHNVNFDCNVMGCEYLRMGQPNPLEEIQTIDTCSETTQFCAIDRGNRRYKSPKLIELYKILFGEDFNAAHDAMYDVEATAKAFFECLKREIIPIKDDTDVKQINYQPPELTDSNFKPEKQEYSQSIISENQSKVEEAIPSIQDFCHLHGHSQFSVLQATPKVEVLIKYAKKLNMKAVALTDLGNMFGVFKFVSIAHQEGILPIVGCEFYVSKERKKLHFTKNEPDRRFRQVLLAKNKNGYQNLIKLSSIAYKEGNYGLYPRIDKELIKQYSQDLIALSGGLQGEIPDLILNMGVPQAEEALKWWIKVFEDDFYLELNRHGLESEDRLNEELLKLAYKHSIKYVAANEFYYLSKEDSDTHDILLCIKENEKKGTPIGRGRGFRFGFKNHNYYFKTREEMATAFGDLPEAILNIKEILQKITPYRLERSVLLPKFDIPSQYVDADDEKKGENEYLRYLAYQGAKKRYKNPLDQLIRERIDFELQVIEKTGYPGYFLIVQDFVAEAKKMDVAVGNGRGSVAGSIVAYCIGVTNVDPIKYDLLFERFLNPDRISMPDIDIDFDNEGREKVLNYVVQKYGSDQVAQIITYGVMAPKSAIRDTARIMEMPLSQANTLAKLIPERPGYTFERAVKEVLELKRILREDDLNSKILNRAMVLEGTLRNIGVHACGVIITPDDMSKHVPLARSKDSELMITQYDNSVVENAGMLKMDFLGLKTLSIIKTCVEYIEKRHNKKIDIEAIRLDNRATFRLYQRGETNGTFQFESAGMQKHLKALKPDRIGDLIAMNALYRPGPMVYIPNFIARKNGAEPITYDLPEMEEYLAETYGITIYQEQVMLLSQKLANFSRGDADTLRKAMGKKNKEILDQLKNKFVEGCKKNDHPEAMIEKIWKDWEAFAAYAFNKSHSTCYSIIAYQTAYLKANYKEEYMASLLTHNQSDIEKISFFMDECKNLNINVLGPHINESFKQFSVNKSGTVRFGLGAVKGTGDAAVEAIIEEREKHGGFKDIFDFSERVNSRSVNKKTFESLANAGAFDCFNAYHRRQYVEPDKEDGISLIEKAIKYASKVQQEKLSAQSSLFGLGSNATLNKPKAGNIEPYGKLEVLRIEKDLLGLYISGHPLDTHHFEMEYLINTTIDQLEDLQKFISKKIQIAGMITSVSHKISKRGKPFGQFVIEDYSSHYTFILFSNEYLKWKPFLEEGYFMFLTTIVQKKWNNENELKLKITDMVSLDSIREKMVKGIKLMFPLDSVNQIFIEELRAICERHLGKKRIHIHIITNYEDQEIILLEALSRVYSVDVTDDFLSSLDKMGDLRYEIVK